MWFTWQSFGKWGSCKGGFCEKMLEAQYSGRTYGLWGPTLEQSVPEGLHSVEGTHVGQVLKNCGPWKGPMLKKIVKDYPVRGTPGWRRGRA